MLLKWKCILTNWINCHFNESDNLEPCVTLESLHSIISHLRENLNLDESKSSILEAHTVEEFVREKYPDFKFESGLVEASSEEELCVVASLLLYFVCVNSKDVDMKNAMCSKLSLEDQEVILKFSKNLMECTPITYKDVQTAISEACGQALAMSEPQSTHSKVSETPPALRSLHGEVRRLQAALDAERFDRNYLQEELARTNLRVEKLSLEKEQYKQEIVNLKAKISMCCGQESDSRAGDTDAEGTAKLMRQLQQAEERLEDTQGLLDDAHYERDIYKAKVDELKQERDKLVTFSQQETARVSQLSEELETERRHVHSLKELVVELRQHHQLNRCDSSQLECDDLDSSLHSLQHNSSICSEACANVVEVQLGEERAKLVLLNQQIQALQEQLNDLTHRSNTEKQNLETIISERDNDVFNLKHRINEEIEEKNYLTIQYSDEVSKLNNEMNELEQKFKDNNNQSRLVIETKMQEIQTLQEEKLSLLQSLNDETIKLENIIKNVKSELDSEKKSKAKIKEDYENHIMKLNEKVLNRNNELVELQNNVFDKSEKIESLHMELRKEKQTREEIVTKLRTEFEQMNERSMEVEHKLQQKCEEVETLLDRLNASHSYVQELRQEIDLLKGSLSDSSDNCRILEETKVKLLNDVQICNNIIEETKAKMIEEIRNRDEKIQELYKEMKNIKNGFCVEKNTLVKDYNEKINALSKNIDETRNELSCQKASYTAVIESRDRDIQTLQQENQSLNNELNDVKLQLDLKVHSLKEKLTDSENLTEKLKQTYECQIENLNVMVTKLGNYLKEKTFELDSIRREKERLLLVVAENNEVIKSLEEELKLHKHNQEKLVSEFDSERLVLKNMVTVTESVMEDQKMALNNVISEHIKENEALKEELKALKNILESERKDAEVKDLENNTLVENTYKELHEIRKEKESLIKEFENERETLVSQINDIQYEMNFEKSQILALQINNKELEENLQKSKDNLSSIEEHNNELKIKKDTQEAEFANKVDKISKELDEQIEENKKLKNVIEEQNKTSFELREEVKSLNNQLEMLIQAKNILEQEKLEIEKEIEEFKAKLVLEITEANKEISRLKEDNFKSTNKVNENKLVIKSLEDETKSQKQNQEKLIHEFEIERQMLKKTVTVAKSVLEDQKVSLHKVITEHSKANQRLKEENKSLRQAMKIEEKTMEKNIQEKNALLELVNKELSELRSEKKILQEDSQTEKQALISNIELLRNDINSKCSLIETLEVANKKLTDELQRCRNDIMLLEVNNNETKADKDSLQTELLNKVEKVSKDFNEQLEINKKLNNKLDETYKLNYLIEEKVKYQQTEIELLTKQEVELTNKINSLSNELNEQENINKVLKAELQTKSALLMKTEECVKALHKEIESLTLTNQKLEQDVNECRTKIEELMIELNRNSVELNKQISKLQEDNLKLTNTVEEYKIVIQSLQDALTLQKQDLIQKNNFIEVEKEVLANKVAAAESALEEQKLNTKAIRSEYSREKETHTEQITKIQEDSKKIRDALNEEIKVAESKIKEKETMLLTINEEVSKLKEDNIKLLKTVAQDKIVIQSLQDTLTSEKEDLLKQINDLQSEKEVLINNVASAKAELEKQKLSAENIESVYIKEKEFLYKQLMELEKESKKIKDTVNQEIKIAECKIKEKDTLLITMNEENNKLKDDNLKLTDTVKENKIVMLSLQDSLTSEKQDIVKQISELQSEKEELVNKVKSAELALEQEKLNTENIESEYLKEKQILTGQMNELKKEGEKLKVAVNDNIKRFECRIKEKETMLETLVRELSEVRREKEDIIKDLESEKKYLSKENDSLKNERKLKLSQIDALECQNKELTIVLQKCQADAVTLQENCGELKIQKDSRETELLNKLENISKELTEHVNVNKHIKAKLEQKEKLIQTLDEKVKALNNQVEVLTKAYNRLEQEKNECKTKLKQITSELDTDALKLNKQVEQLKEDNIKLANVVEEKTLVIQNLEQAITQEKALNNEIQTRNKSEKLNLNNKCSILQEYQIKAEKQLEEREKDMVTLQEELKTLKSVVDVCEYDLCEKNGLIEEKNAVINTMNKELVEEKAAKEKIQIELEAKAAVFDLRQKLESAKTDEALKALRNEEWVRAVVQRETISLAGSERIGSHHKNSSPVEKDYRDFQHQVDNTTSDLTHSSMESFKTISDLEKIIHDKNRTITALQSDITYLKSLIADSENNLLDMTKELEISKENCHQLSVQLKKIVHQKNEEIADLKKQVIKMSAMESKATQIIRVSAKYQAIILKRIAEIKSNTILKELTNFGNTSNGDNDLRRSLNTGAVTMEDLENFLETTDKHLRRCSEKQIALQKERDRLTEVNRINESEIINLKKFLTELSVSFKTFNSVKDLYSQKLSRVLSIQRTVRREVLNLDGRIDDATMCKLERGYAAVMQDLTECVMNMERWMERCISRTTSPEKIKQAFTSNEERVSLASTSFQNTSLEVQFEELEMSFQKLLEDIVRAQKGEGARDAQAVTVMEVRAEYEDKLNRMKAKMKQLYQEQITVFKDKQKEEIAMLERELLKTREKLAESSKAYEEHIRALTTELWSVGEKFLTKKDEVDWLRKKQKSGSLMSLQHVHSSGLVQRQEEPPRPSDSCSLRSLPVHNNNIKRERRGLHMSDEEGEVFDNRWLQELAATPRGRASSVLPSTPGGPGRISELKWRNSLCPPHLKSSYPAETQFAPVLDEEDIKCIGATGSIGGRNQRKEVGITAYKKPGPPTPSKQAGRLSATDSELRESMRMEPEAQPSRKTSTPSRLRSLFRSNKTDTTEGTPRSRRLSIFRKK